MDNKTCTKCLTSKHVESFGVDVRYAGGHKNWCKQCCKEHRASHYLANKERIRKQNSEWHQANKERVAEYGRQYYAENKEWVTKRIKAARERNPELYKEINRRNRANRLATRPELRIHSRISSQLKYCIPTGKGGRATQELIGYPTSELRDHLEKQFLKGMSFENFGKWHIDHIIPVSSFDLTTDEGIRAAWAITNLRPLWAKDNIKKGAKMEFLL